MQFVFILFFINGLKAKNEDEKTTIREKNETYVTKEELNMIVFDIVQDLKATKEDLK